MQSSKRGRSKRIIQSTTPSSPGSQSPAPVARSDGAVQVKEEEGELEEEEDAAGEYESEEDAALGRSRVSSVIVSDDMELDESDEDAKGEPEYDDAVAQTATPSSSKTGGVGGLRIKLKFGGGAEAGPSGSGNGSALGKRPARVAAKKAVKQSKKVALDSALGSEDEDEALFADEADELESADFGSRATSPSKLTARQRAKGNKDLQDTLIALPNDGAGKKQIILTEAERQQKREETARRRKRQSEQKLQDEQDQTINRLLRAQTGRSRAKLDNPSPATGEEGSGVGGTAGGTGASSPSKRPPRVTGDFVRWVSSIRDGEVVLRVAAPKGKEEWISLEPTEFKAVDEEEGKGKKGVGVARCDVPGCQERRKYRSTRKLEVGGCSLEHLRAVNDGLAAEDS